MKPLTIEMKKGAPSQFQSVAWKTSKPDDCRREFYALDQTGKPLVVTPKPAMPEFYDPNRHAKAVFSCEPFPAAVCVEISPCRLLPPPCYKSHEDFDGQLPCHSTFEPWKWIYWKMHQQVLIAEPSDDGPLQERLKKWLTAMRAAYEHERKTVRTEIERQTTKPLAELGYENEEQRNKRVSELQAYLVNIVESETPIGNAVCKGRLKLTLEDIKNGHEGIRDAWMQEDWAKKNGWDLGVMRRERMVFRRWLETHTGTHAIVHDMTTRRSHCGVAATAGGIARPLRGGAVGRGADVRAGHGVAGDGARSGRGLCVPAAASTSCLGDGAGQRLLRARGEGGRLRLARVCGRDRLAASVRRLGGG